LGWQEKYAKISTSFGSYTTREWSARLEGGDPFEEVKNI
jgi:hypothetical protein